MQEISVTWSTLLAIAAALVVLFNAGKVIFGMFDPFKQLKARTDKHGELLEKDNARIRKLEEVSRAIMAALFALLNNAITGNSIDGLKAARDQLQAHLVEK